MRITCRYVKTENLLYPPTLNEGEGEKEIINFLFIRTLLLSIVGRLLFVCKQASDTENDEVIRKRKQKEGFFLSRSMMITVKTKVFYYSSRT